MTSATAVLSQQQAFCNSKRQASLGDTGCHTLQLLSCHGVSGVHMACCLKPGFATEGCIPDLLPVPSGKFKPSTWVPSAQKTQVLKTPAQKAKAKARDDLLMPGAVYLLPHFCSCAEASALLDLGAHLRRMHVLGNALTFVVICILKLPTRLSVSPKEGACLGCAVLQLRWQRVMQLRQGS